MGEIRMAVRQIKNGKAARPDNIPAEALKSDIEATTNMLYLLFKKIWEEEQVPMDWKERHLVKILKKGDLSKCKNYRGITLLSIPGKVFNRVLLTANFEINKLDSVRIDRAQTKLQHYGSSSNNHLTGTRHCTPTSSIMKRHLTV
ncbi:unnamed protein product [Schistosoma margrebowiei]|uniref:Uncharacterized protein n=1 Tax=Schistosoma margrebowiei TaxID=48269 RepID=A0A183L8H9_9TREM|nr:unnamed protein product [Schistosoma margrebowiei]